VRKKILFKKNAKKKENAEKNAEKCKKIVQKYVFFFGKIITR